MVRKHSRDECASHPVPPLLPSGDVTKGKDVGVAELVVPVVVAIERGRRQRRRCFEMGGGGGGGEEEEEKEEDEQYV